MDIETITIDNKEYIIAEELENNNTTYLYLVNEQDENDTFIRKLSANKEEIIPLNNEKEVIEAGKLFLQNIEE